MHQHDKEQLEARGFAVECFFTSQGRMPDAIQRFQSEWNKGRDCPIADVRGFIQYNVEKFRSHQTLHDLGGQGRDVIMPDEVVREIGSIIAQGHTKQRSCRSEGKDLPWIEGLHFTSLSEAIRESPRIQELQSQYPAKGGEEGQVKYLWRRLHEVVPTLVYQHLPMKRPLSDADKQQRVEYAENRSADLEEDPDMLYDGYWADEVSIWINKHECGQLMMWFEKHDVHGLPPAENVFCAREGSVRLEVLLIVSARRGLVWVEFLTGTTDLERDGRHNEMMRLNMRIREELGLGCYKVRA